MKVIIIKNCKECVHSYENIFLSFNAELVCGEPNITTEKIKIKDRIIKSDRIPKWCKLEDLK